MQASRTLFSKNKCQYGNICVFARSLVKRANDRRWWLWVAPLSAAASSASVTDVKLFAFFTSPGLTLCSRRSCTQADDIRTAFSSRKQHLPYASLLVTMDNHRSSRRANISNGSSPERGLPERKSRSGVVECSCSCFKRRSLTGRTLRQTKSEAS